MTGREPGPRERRRENGGTLLTGPAFKGPLKDADRMSPAAQRQFPLLTATHP